MTTRSLARRMQHEARPSRRNEGRWAAAQGGFSVDITKKKMPRRFRRFSVLRHVNVTCRQEGTFPPITCFNTHVLDLSEAGARLLVTTPLRRDQKIALTVQTTFARPPLVRQGRIVWCFQV